MKPTVIRAAIEKLRERRLQSPSTHVGYESELLALADLVDQTVSAIDGQAQREMTARQLHLLADLRAAVPLRKEAP